MVYCCVPQCGTDSWRCDPSIIFHDFPPNPDLAAKWIRQINNALKSEPMWFPRAKSVVCSKHFLSTDYKDDTDALKNRVVPTVFGSKYIGQNSDVEEIAPINQDKSSGPLIVKIKTEEGDKEDVVISGVYSQNELLEAVINESENLAPSDLQPTSKIPTVPRSFKTYSKQVNMGIQPQTFQEISSNAVNTPETITNANKIILIDETNKQIQTPNQDIHPNTISSTLSKPVQKIKQNVQKIVKTPKTQNKVSEKSKAIKKPAKKRDNNDSNLIEIGPNTFLKINPDIIKINKKQTPSGNTVLQFLMDQNLANSIGTDVLPKIVQGAISNIGDATNNLKKKSNPTPSSNENEKSAESPKTVQHVVGHLVDTHVCKESCTNLEHMNSTLMETNDIEQGKDDTMDGGIDDIPDERGWSPTYDKQEATTNENLLEKQNDSTCIAKAPVLLTTNMPLAHCFMEKTKYLSNLRQKVRQIASLKQKVASLNKKIEELEDKCIVQERQLSLGFLKKLKAIRKNASKGDPPATYILEQIRAYSGQKQMRWSDSTLQQCGVWCKKAPYAYEYFKKADFFKLPCLGTVKRFMKKHPEMIFSNKAISNTTNDGESSSDFNFDDEDLGEDDKMTENQNEQEVSELEETNHSADKEQNCEVVNQVEGQNTVEVVFQQEASSENSIQNVQIENATKSKAYPVTVDGTRLEIQELLLPSGEVVQCYSSNICNSDDPNNQYYIIPGTGDSGTVIEHEYSIVQSGDSLPVILQNLEHSNLQQEQLILITNSSDQVECTETEVMTAR